MAARETAKAAVVSVKAQLVKEAAGAVNAYVNAQEKGIALPAGLMRLIAGDE